MSQRSEAAAGPVPGGPGQWEEHRVPVGETTLVARVRAGSGPAVVFEAGLGLPGASWQPVCDRLPADRSLLYYDRAGLGRSGPGVAPRTGTRQLAELRELLRELGIAPPYILVGHSAGAFVARLFALEHPAEVAALVLVDPSHEDEEHARPALLRWVDSAGSWLLRGAAGVARRGALEWAHRLAQRVPLPRRHTSGDRASLLTHMLSPQHLEGAVREDEAFPTTVDEVRRAEEHRSMPPVPVRVITAEGAYNRLSRLHRAAHTEQHRIRALHARLAAASPRGLQVVAPRSGHMVMTDDPDLVARTVADVL
jgi:pimeloyl-ACP methyl ester carboxylesterase